MRPLAYMEGVANLLTRVTCTYRGGKSVGLDEAVGTVCTRIKEAAAAGRLVMCVGNGGSAAMAAHLAEDLVKLRGVKAMAFDSVPLLTCLGNDVGFEHVYEYPVGLFADAGVLVAVSSSGESEDILRAARVAKRRGCVVVTLTGFVEGNALRQLGGVNFWVPSDKYGLVESAHAALVHCLVDCK